MYAALKRLAAVPAAAERPRVVCLCGSTRFISAFAHASQCETLEGHIVLSIGIDLTRENPLPDDADLEELVQLKQGLDALHLRKIDLADEILVINAYGYIGDSTRREIAYARAQGKPVRWYCSHLPPATDECVDALADMPAAEHADE